MSMNAITGIKMHINFSIFSSEGQRLSSLLYSVMYVEKR